ncbi:MAG TPA: hypothetical protein VGH38_07030 [Bryobacteraceae bacterium]
MQLARVLGGLALAAAVMVPLSSASANDYWHHRNWHRWHHGYWYRGPVAGVFDAAGAVVEGAVTIASAPFVLVGDILSPGPYYDPVARHAYDSGYYGPQGGYYANAGYYGPPRRSCRCGPSYYGPPPGY